MLDKNFIRNNEDAIRKNILERHLSFDFDLFLEIDDQRSKLLSAVEALRQERNQNSESIKKLSNEQREQAISHGRELKEQLTIKEEQLTALEKKYQELFLQIPNMTHPDSPRGSSENENKEIERYGERRRFSFQPQDHLTIAENLDAIDFKKAATVTGSRFYYLKNDLVLLEFALIQYVLGILVNRHKFVPLITPDLARTEIIQGTGFNPRGEESQVYLIEGHELGLIGTAEITVAGYHTGDIIPSENLPLKYVAISHCFRNEAGSYGKYSKGLYRVHQFTKVEMFIYCLPEESEKLHEELKKIEIEIFSELGLPFRVIDICTADLGGPAYRKYDLESWMYGREGNDPEYQGDWGEITSTSNCTDYQARRLNIKYKKGDEQNFLHTLNGTAMALSRAPIAILEHYQEEDGSVRVPDVLQKYMGKTHLKPKSS